MPRKSDDIKRITGITASDFLMNAISSDMRVMSININNGRLAS
jgi:hypothetical protein